jgi:hypothetical protein
MPGGIERVQTKKEPQVIPAEELFDPKHLLSRPPGLLQSQMEFPNKVNEGFAESVSFGNEDLSKELQPIETKPDLISNPADLLVTKHVVLIC